MIKLALWFIGLWMFLAVCLVHAQNPQTQTAPIYAVNAKYDNGVAPGYWPTQLSIANGSGGTIAAATGLNINVGPGTVNCGSGTIVSYVGGTKALTASATNRIYLDTTSSCAVSVKTTAFVGTDIPLAVVVAGSSTITSISDVRTPFNVPPIGSGLADPGGNGFVYRTSLNVTAVGTLSQLIAAYWFDSSCATDSILQKDGTCTTGGGSGAPFGGTGTTNPTVNSATTLAALVTACGSGPTTIQITIPLSPTTISTPKNCALQFSDGGSITYNAGQTITINGPILAPDNQQVFINGGGTLVVNSQNYWKSVGWFGAVADGVFIVGGGTGTDNSAAWTACQSSITLGVCYFAPGVYRSETGPTITTQNTGVECGTYGWSGSQGGFPTVIFTNSASVTQLFANGGSISTPINGFILKNCMLARTNTPSSGSISLRMNYTSSAVVERNNFADSAIGIQSLFNPSGAQGTFTNNLVSWCYTGVGSAGFAYVGFDLQGGSTGYFSQRVENNNVSNRCGSSQSASLGYKLSGQIQDLNMDHNFTDSVGTGISGNGTLGGDVRINNQTDDSPYTECEFFSLSGGAAQVNTVYINNLWCALGRSSETNGTEITGSGSVSISDAIYWNGQNVPSLFVHSGSLVNVHNSTFQLSQGHSGSGIGQGFVYNASIGDISHNRFIGNGQVWSTPMNQFINTSNAVFQGNLFIAATGPAVNFDASSNNNQYANITNSYNGMTFVDTTGTNSLTVSGSTTNSLTMDNSGIGDASGSTFNGSVARKISYNTIGAAPLNSPTFTGTVTIPSGASIAGFAPLASPTFIGTPSGPTASGGTSTGQFATTAFVQAAIAAAGTGAGIVTYSGPSLTFSGTQFFPIGGGATASTTETNVDIDSPAAVTIQNMTVQMSAAPGVGNSAVYTWRKNASDTALTCTISGASATSCSDTSHNFTTASLDLLDIKAVTTGTIIGTPTVVMAAQVGLSATTSTAWSAVTPATNANAGNFNMGNGTVLGPTGTGVVNANQVNGATIPVSQTSLASDSSGHIIAGSGSGNAFNIGSLVTWTPSGGMAGSFSGGVFTVTTAGSTLTVTGIPSTFLNLYPKVFGAMASNGVINAIFNADTGTHYEWNCEEMKGNGSSQVTSCGGAASAAAITNAFIFGSLSAEGTMEIPNYTNTTFPKAIHVTGTYFASSSSQTNNSEYFTRGIWNPTSQAAITSITFTCGVNCAIGSQFQLLASN